MGIADIHLILAECGLWRLWSLEAVKEMEVCPWPLKTTWPFPQALGICRFFLVWPELALFSFREILHFFPLPSIRNHLRSSISGNQVVVSFKLALK